MINKKITALIMVGALGLNGLTGCSSYSERQSAKYNEMNEKRIKQALLAKEKKTEEKIKALSDMPEWVLMPLTPDLTGIYSSGMGEHENLEIAKSIASLNAKANLAKTIKSNISLEEVRTVDDSGNSGYSSTTDNFINGLSIKKSTIMDSATSYRDGKYTVYLLVKVLREDLEQENAKGKSSALNKDQYQRLLNRIEVANLEKSFKDN